MTTNVLYSRYTDGSKPVRVVQDGWLVTDHDGTRKKFTTCQGLLAELTGHPTGRHWSLDRYFKTEESGEAWILDLFGDSSSRLVIDQPLAPRLISLRSSYEITVPEGPEVGSSGGVVVSPVGIDLKNRADEVRKILFAGYGRQIYAAGYDQEDVLQDVYRGILARNHGKCPWDPRKSSFGHYVHMVSGCILKNYHRKVSRVRSHEQVGITYMQEDGYRHGDVASATNLAAGEALPHRERVMHEAAEDLAEYILETSDGRGSASLAIAIIPHMVAGDSRKHIAGVLGVSMSALSRAIKYLRQAASDWRNH